MADLKIKSPDSKKALELSYLGEIRFGPAYFSFTPVGFECPSIETKKIGQEIYWSDDSRFVFLVIFHSIESSKSPDMELVQIDTKTFSVKNIERNFSGMINPIGFEKGFFKYESVAKGVVGNKKIPV